MQLQWASARNHGHIEGHGLGCDETTWEPLYLLIGTSSSVVTLQLHWLRYSCIGGASWPFVFKKVRCIALV